MAFDLTSIFNPVGSLISGIGGLISTNQTNKANLAAVREQNKANRELAELQYKRNLDMWERQNVYNSPAEQMKRLTDAGLNPNLIYGNGSASTGNAANPPQYDAPHIERYQTNEATGIGQFAGQAGQAISDIGQMMLLSEQIDTQREINRNWQLKNEKFEAEQPYFTDIANFNRDKRTYMTSKYRFDSFVADYLSNRHEQYAQALLDDKVKTALLKDTNIRVNEKQLSRISADIDVMRKKIWLMNKQGKLVDNQSLYTQYKSEIEGILSRNGINLRDSTDRLVNAILGALSGLSNVDPDSAWGLGSVPHYIGSFAGKVYKNGYKSIFQ